MTSNEFEKIAKEEVIRAMKSELGTTVSPDELELTWFNHTLGNKKCMLWGKPMGTYYAEVTFSVEKNKVWTDIYRKIVHKELVEE